MGQYSKGKVEAADPLRMGVILAFLQQDRKLLVLKSNLNTTANFGAKVMEIKKKNKIKSGSDPPHVSRSSKNFFTLEDINAPDVSFGLVKVVKGRVNS